MSDPSQRVVRIQLHGNEGFQAMRRAGNLAAECLDHVTPHVRAGVTSDELDRICHDFIVGRGAIPAPLNYKGFPRSICVSRNDVVCHGIPGDDRLEDGDIVNVDVTAIVDGWHGDTSRMFLVGQVPDESRRLVDLTYDAMMRGIETIRPGATLGDLGHAIQSLAEGHGYSMVRDFCGHGIGRFFHGPPNVLHFGRPGRGPELRQGMFFTVEPMVNTGRHEVRVLQDNWTAVTCDGSLSAQFEHTVGVTADGFEIFTLSPRGWHRPPYE